MIVQKLKRSIAEQRAEEQNRSEVEKQGALLEYLATMTDVDLPTEDTGSTEGSEMDGEQKF